MYMPRPNILYHTMYITAATESHLVVYSYMQGRTRRLARCLARRGLFVQESQTTYFAPGTSAILLNDLVPGAPSAEIRTPCVTASVSSVLKHESFLP